MKKKVFDKRLIALLLCCFCLLAALPTSVTAFETDMSETMPTETESIVEEFETEIAETEAAAETEMITTEMVEEDTERITEESTEVAAESTERFADTTETIAEEAEENAEVISNALEEENEDTPTTIAETKLTATIKNELQNVIVTYAYRTEGDDGWKWADAYTSNFQIQYDRTKSGEKDNYYVFFVKPIENHLLTTFSIENSSGGTSYDLYSIDNTSSNISKYPDFTSLIQEAKSRGYLGFNGYKSSAAGNITLTQKFTGQKPSLHVTATANPNNNVKPGEDVTFTVNLNPQTVSEEDKITNVVVKSLTINGKSYENVSLVQNGDTYTAVLDYTATSSDWLTGEIKLEVDAEVSYQYVLPVTDRDENQSKITTNSTISNQGMATCLLATNYGVAYELRYNKPDDIEVPNTIPIAPLDEARYFEGEDVVVKEYDTTPIDDPENGGTWTFSGWDYEEKQYSSGNSIKMSKGGILLVGNWKFEKYPTTTITVGKTLSGNIYDANKRFAFTITSQKGITIDESVKTEHTFYLGKDETVDFTVLVGDHITITENPEGYTYSLNSATTITEYTDIGNGVTFTVPNTGGKVVFCNEKSIELDTGILLDTSPYVLILTMVTGASVLLLKKRRSYE